jgi:hypothetical protein
MYFDGQQNSTILNGGLSINVTQSATFLIVARYTGNTGVFDTTNNVALINGTTGSYIYGISATNQIACGDIAASSTIFINGIQTNTIANINNYNLIECFFTGLTTEIYYNLATNNGIDTPWIGNISEILVFPRIISVGERQQIEGYLSWKWGLQTYLPFTHLYRKYSSTPLPSYINSIVDL